ncbi:MAG: GNAT family N-acetyltransferase [Candidatus Thermoplasmatota archaeon]|nr:GNAT family N-acetyltransferase [Candidatus Thermoplasmatota archaeon]
MLKEKASEYLSREPIVNSYQIARLNEEEPKVFLDDEEDPSGVLILRDETVTLRGRKITVQDLLSGKLEKSKEYRFHAVDHQSFKAAEDVIEIKDDRPTWMLVRLYESPSESKSDVKPLEEKDASVINEYWGLGSDDSTDYIESRIDQGPAYGIRKDGELIGWCLTHFVTERAMVMGMLHVKEKWRRKGFAEDLTEALCEEAEEKDLVPAVQIFKDNEPSLSLAEDLGFEKRAEHHWFSGVKK